MLHRVRQVGAGAVARAAANDVGGVVDHLGVLGIAVGEYPALVDQIVAAFGGPHLHIVSLGFVVCGQLHQAQVWPVVAVHIV